MEPAALGVQRRRPCGIEIGSVADDEGTPASRKSSALSRKFVCGGERTGFAAGRVFQHVVAARRRQVPPTKTTLATR